MTITINNLPKSEEEHFEDLCSFLRSEEYWNIDSWITMGDTLEV